jgi:hypothetical protein
MILRKLKKLVIVTCTTGACLLQFAGCGVDPDIPLRASIFAGSELAIFLLENAARGL